MFRFPPLTPVIKQALIAIGATFIIVLCLERFAQIPASQLLVLLPDPGLYWSWQFFTQAFIYPPEALFSALLSLVFLWWMGAPFEARYGGKHTLGLFAVAIAASSLGGMIGSVLLPTRAIFGISPLLLALIAGLAASIPWNATVNFFGVLPMKNSHLLIAFGIFVVLSEVVAQNYGGIVSAFAAGGAGYYYVKWMMTPKKRKKKAPKKNGARRGNLRVIEGGGESDEEERPKYLN